MVQLEKSLSLREEKADILAWLGEFSSSKGLTQQLDPMILHLELKEALKQVLLSLQLAEADGNQDVCLLLSQSALSRPSFQAGHWPYRGVLTDEEARIFDELVILNHKELYGSKQSQKSCQVIQRDQGLNEINAQGELLPREPELRGGYQLLPIVLPASAQLVGHLIFRPGCLDSDASRKLDLLADVLARFLDDLSEKRHAYQALQEQHNRLLQQLEGEQVTQEAKDLITSLLIIPYARKPTLKSLGEGIDALADKLVTNDYERAESANSESADFGQEINQIAYFKQGLYIEDIRLYHTYNPYKDCADKPKPGNREPNAPDEMLLQSFTQQQQIVYEDEVLDKVVMLYPFVQSLLSSSSVHF